MGSNVKIYSDIDMQSGNVNLAQNDEVPSDPRVGNMCTIAGIIHFFTSVDGSDPFWMPIMHSKSTYIHKQSDPATVWTCTHDLSTDDLLVQVYDADGGLIYAKPIFTSLDELEIRFSEPTDGKAILFGASSKFAGFSPNAESLTSDTVTFGEGTPGEFDSSSIYFSV